MIATKSFVNMIYSYSTVNDYNTNNKPNKPLDIIIYA